MLRLVHQLERAAGWAAARSRATAVQATSQAAQLSTGGPGESLWQQTLRSAAAAMGVGGGGSGTGASQAALQASQPLQAQHLPLQSQWQRQLAQQPQQQKQQAATACSLAAEEPAAAAEAAAQDVAAGSHVEQRVADGGKLIGISVGGGGGELVPVRMGEPYIKAKQERRQRRPKKKEPAAAVAEAAAAADVGQHAGAWQASLKQQHASDSRGAAVAGNAGEASSTAGKGRKKKQGEQQQQDQQHSSNAAASLADGDAAAIVAATSAAVGGACPLPPPVVLQDDLHPIRDEDVSRPAWFVLSRLRAAGHEAYVVGGTIRDLLLGGTPKDYDLLTTAELHQVKRLFKRSIIVGRSFPVCQVHADGTMIEVTSFSTNADPREVPTDASIHLIGRHKPKQKGQEGGGATWAAARATNASRRDFTVNGLLYDPFSRLLFDAVGGVADCQARRLRTICPPSESFAADPARILRGVRLAARAGLELDGETAAAMEEQATAISQLPQGRLQMELGSLLGYGAAERSLELMWRLGLMHLLLPQHALYLRRHKVPRAPRTASASSSTTTATATSAASGSRRGTKRDLLYELAAELDKHVTPQKPVDPSVWVAILAAPLVAEHCAKLAAEQQGRQQVQVLEQRQGAAGEGSIGNAKAGGWVLRDGELRAVDGDSSDSESSSHSSSDGGSSSGTEEEDEEGAGEDEGAPLARPPHGRHQRRRVSREEAVRRQYLEQYSQVVGEVLDTMQQTLDAATLASLGRQAKKHIQQLQAGGAVGGGRRGRRRSRGATAQDGVLLPCVLSKAALDRAAALLLLEADLRGRPELQLLLGNRSDTDAPAAAPTDTAGAAGERQPDMGQKEQQPQGVWQRLERAIGVVAAGNSGATLSASLTEGGNARQRRHHRQGRRLSAEERLVLGILSDPRFDFAARTSMPCNLPAGIH